MFVDLDNKKGAWFTFRMSEIDQNTGNIVWGDEIPELEVQIRSMKPFFEERIRGRERGVGHVYNVKSRAMDRETFFKDLTPDESKAERDDAFDYAITGLKGFKSRATREPYPCTREVKIGLMAYDWFDRFFADCQQKIDSLSIEMEEKESKNSAIGSSSLTNADPV
jgi:hypothetical protein